VNHGIGHIDASFVRDAGGACITITAPNRRWRTNRADLSAWRKPHRAPDHRSRPRGTRWWATSVTRRPGHNEAANFLRRWGALMLEAGTGSKRRGAQPDETGPYRPPDGRPVLLAQGTQSAWGSRLVDLSSSVRRCAPSRWCPATGRQIRHRQHHPKSRGQVGGREFA